MIYPDVNILWEAKSKRVIVDAYETGDLEKFRKDIARGVQEGIAQTHEIAIRIHNNKFLEQRLTDTCMPVIVTLDTYPGYGLLGEELEQLGDKRPDNVLPHLVLDSGSFNLLCMYVVQHGLNMLSELREWQNAWRESGYLLTMNEFLTARHTNLRPPSALRRILEQIQEDAKGLYGFKG